MSKHLLVAALFLSLPLMANEITVAPADLTVTKVTVETPLPTGLESVAAGPGEANELYAAIKKDSRIAPFIAAAEKKYLKAIKDAEKYANHATVDVDCNEHPSPFGAEDKSKCKLTVRRTYGWYADLSLILTVDGYINKSIAKRFEQ